jgi:DNA-binding SARP family transcriptional activator/Flp pilus assembly protein TadD
MHQPTPIHHSPDPEPPRIAVLGPVRAWIGDRELTPGPPAQRAVLALLAMALPRPVSREELVDALWGDSAPLSAANVVQTHVKHLRRILEPDRRVRGPSRWLVTVGAGYALRIPVDSVDIGRFRRLASAAAGALRAGAPAEATDLLGAALDLWSGAPLADVPTLAEYPVVRSLAAEWRTALIRYADTLADLGRTGTALPLLVDAVETHPLDEELRARLVDAYRIAGQRAEAFAAYEVGRRALAAELGVSPGAALAAAHVALLPTQQTPAAGSASRAPATARNASRAPATARNASRAPATAGHRARAVPAQLPADVVSFVGRAAELATLDRLRGAGTAPTIAAICGTAGVGKTALAVHWAHRVRREFPDGQLYVDLRGYDLTRPVSPAQALAGFLEALGVPSTRIPLDPDDRATRFRTAVADLRILVVLDNAASVEQVRPLLPGSPSCRVLVTSRDSLAGLVARHGAVRVEVPLLPADDAIALLRLLVGARVDAEPGPAVALAEQCARLPLALRVAAELVSTRPDNDLAALVTELADRVRRLAALDAGGDARSDMRVVFSWSLQHLPDPAGQLFRLLGRHPGPDVDSYAAAALAGTDLLGARRLLAALARAYLVEPVGDRYTMHDLLRAFAAELTVDAPAGADTAMDRLYDFYLAASCRAMDVLYPADRAQRPAAPAPATPLPPLSDAAAARSWLDEERATLAAACGYAAAGERPDRAVRLAAILHRHLEGGHPIEALAIQRDALLAADRCGDETARVRALTDLGVTYRLLGRYDEAADHLQQAARLAQAHGDLAGEARVRSNLGILDERRGRHTDAASQHRKALQLQRAVGDRYGEAAALTNLGTVYIPPPHQERAARYLRRAVLLFRELGDRAGTATALTNLADACIEMGHYPRAAEHLAEALALFRALGHRYGEAVALANLGAVQTHLGRFDLAATHLREALDAFREDGNRYGEASALNGLGAALHGMGRQEEASARHTEALTIAVGTGDRDEEARARAGIARARTG